MLDDPAVRGALAVLGILAAFILLSIGAALVKDWRARHAEEEPEEKRPERRS